MAMICLGGCDATGKSTICNNLSKLLHCDIVHFDKPKDLEDGKNQYFGFLDKEYISKNIICDRFHDGEWIYAPLYRGYEGNYLDELEIELKKFPFLFINTTASLETILNRVNRRGEDFVKQEHFQIILDKYDEFLKKQSMPYIQINTDDNNTHDHVKKILFAIDIVQQLYDFAVNIDCKNNYYGNIYAKYFVISDDNNIKEKLINKNIYKECWITTTENKQFIDYQLMLLSSINNNIIVMEDK